EGFRRTARELNAGLLAAIGRRGAQGDSLAAATELIDRLATVEAPGRMVVESDPQVLAVRPELDTVLESGDSIVVPKTPNFVLALGDVSNPGALQFIAGKSAKDYLSEAGGLQSTAESDRAFLVLPNGTAQPLNASFWRRTASVVPPGSTIIVPKEIDPGKTLDIVSTIATIFGQFATGIASIAILATQ
ncbi:MAG: capsule biosynthesis GfcC family protein, partial [Sphingomonadaceae bacterium]|nr:capsule biosynthesis GfcC family protein [Sphingomonadaceae bacterium]